MKNVKIYKKNIVIFALTLGITCALTKSCNKSEVSIVTEDSEAFGQYSNGLVYIGDEKYLLSLDGLDHENDVLVEDLRDTSDPDMKIINSYVVDNRQQMKEIIHLLCLYEEMYPSDWDRSEDAMFREWIAHNILFSLQYETKRTIDVDFNNADEDVYKRLVFKILN